jgi:hypothetical protein
MQEHEKTELEALVEAAAGINDRVQRLATDEGLQFETLAQKAHRNRMLATVAIVGLILDVLITIVLTFIGLGMQSNTDRIDALTQRLDRAQTTQRQKALCPLYQVFLDSKSPQGRAAAPDPDKYDHAFVVIKQGYDALECDHYITGTPAPVSPGP